MNIAAELFSLVCGRGRCFVVDGSALPLCERCLGLYVGGALGGAWILARRLWRFGLPPASVLAVQSAALLAAMLGGLHVIDLGPAWRLACGLWTGQVAITWLVAGAGEFGGPNRLPWPRGDAVAAIVMPPILGLATVAFAALTPGPRALWTSLALAGAACFVAAVLAVACALVARVTRALAHTGKTPMPRA